ncbi:hypothetical protein [Roseburia faecis]|jgi:hypothetical protein|uniref:hypothetical protein n=1 Tax=Roseburia faecis TaxID=301302 RepID=UPI0031B5AB49
MGRMVKIAVTNEIGDSNQLYKIGTKWFKNKEHYINTLKSSDLSYQTVLDLLESDKNCLFSDNVKTKIIKLLENEL